jgi:hypothetical protein
LFGAGFKETKGKTRRQTVGEKGKRKDKDERGRVGKRKK